MMSGIGAELSVFLQAILTGNLVYLTYCVLRIIRRIIKHNLFWVSLEDILFWIGHIPEHQCGIYGTNPFRSFPKGGRKAHIFPEIAIGITH